MDWYYSHILKYNGKLDCYEGIIQNQNIILNAIKELNNFVNGSGTEQDFINAC